MTYPLPGCLEELLIDVSLSRKYIWNVCIFECIFKHIFLMYMYFQLGCNSSLKNKEINPNVCITNNPKNPEIALLGNSIRALWFSTGFSKFEFLLKNYLKKVSLFQIDRPTPLVLTQ